ncbi:MAG: hypothetical protein B7X04_04310 [Parcubacteria group bacterium 21-54-25]|nr:MAG: hypothetical protein B7X04_04310 [Parcubacteria group bacterium 21-54-25]
MPSVSEKQHNAMEAAAHGHSTLGIPESVGKEFVKADGADEPMHELDMAKAIMAGELSSPQKYENIWLFDVRVTGTGTSFRQALDEYVYRPPEDFLSDDFIQRCNGLPLIFEHPTDGILDTKEYRDRAIGMVILPYLKGDEVWGIAKVFDDDAAQLMLTSHVSTSPAVVFRDAGSTETIELSDGKTVLIEGKPSYLDHLAICEEGVWDKGGTPSGVNINEDSTMASEDKAPAWADELGKRFDSICSRMDAIENKGGDKFEAKADSAEEKEEVKEEEKKDSAEEVEDSACKDSEEEKGEKEEKEEKKDARKDSDEEKERKDRKDAQSRENADLRAQIRAMDARLTGLSQPLSNADRDALSAAQAKAESVARLFGDSVNAPLHGESPIAYRKRLVAKFQKHSAAMKDARLDSLDGPSFDAIERIIYSDAQAVALNPANAPRGQLVEHRRADAAGRQITTYTGDIDSWLSTFKSPGYTATINRNHHKGAN